MTVLPPLPSLQAARRAAERAIELDPELPDAHGQLGYLQVVHERNWPAAEARLLRALDLAPALASAHARYGWCLMMNRRFAEARACYTEARALDPLSLLYRTHEALIALYERDFGRCEAGLGAGAGRGARPPAGPGLRAALLLYAGQTDNALAAYQALHQRVPGLSIGRCGLAQALALRGDGVAARHELQRLMDAHDAGYVSPYQIAMVQARLGDDAQALHWLAEAARQIDFNTPCACAVGCKD
jgi:tetratricopeptide (TPR) repeat protein